MTAPMNRQAKRMMAKQGTDKPRGADKPAVFAPRSERTGPRPVLPRGHGRAEEGRLADALGGHQLVDRRDHRRRRHGDDHLRVRLLLRSSSSTSSSADDRDLRTHRDGANDDMEPFEAQFEAPRTARPPRPSPTLRPKPPSKPTSSSKSSSRRWSRRRSSKSSTTKPSRKTDRGLVEEAIVEELVDEALAEDAIEAERRRRHARSRAGRRRAARDRGDPRVRAEPVRPARAAGTSCTPTPATRTR